MNSGWIRDRMITGEKAAYIIYLGSYRYPVNKATYLGTNYNMEKPI